MRPWPASAIPGSGAELLWVTDVWRVFYPAAGEGTGLGPELCDPELCVLETCV